MKPLLPTSPEGRRALWLVPLILTVLIICFDKAVMPLVVSTGRTVTVPNIVGMERKQAVDLLESQGLIVENIVEQVNPAVPAGRITSQLPYPNSHVKEGRRIYLTISKGEALSLMPDLTYLPLRDAQLSVMRVGLQIGTVDGEHRDSVPGNSVLRQSIAAGSRIKAGLIVDLVVSKDSTSAVVDPSIIGLGFDEAVQRLQAAGLEPGTVVKKSSETYTAGTVSRQIPEANTSVPPDTKVELWVVSD
ncbi:MAG: PASTA domain-containing protein [Candidatus Kapaibacterium sp.]